MQPEMTEDDRKKAALAAAIWVTCSPHEWAWTHDQQIAMARYCIEAAKELELWRWLTEMRCTVQEGWDWVVLDVDGKTIGRGATPQLAIQDARESIEQQSVEKLK